MAINMSSILKKAQTFMGSSTGKKYINITKHNILNGIEKGQSGSTHTAYEAGEKFAEVLRDTIQSSDLPDGVVTALEDLEVSGPYQVNGDYVVEVSFSKDTARETLSTHKSYYTIHLDDLYDNGVDHVMKTIFERINKKLYTTSPIIYGANFKEAAINSFMNGYSKEYNVKIINVLDKQTE